jgi:putative DNA primase/helicase
LNLRDGECRLQNPADYITKISGTAPDPLQRIPHWRAFLDRVTGGDAELIAFLRRVAGYYLTGVAWATYRDRQKEYLPGRAFAE